MNSQQVKELVDACGGKVEVMKRLGIDRRAINVHCQFGISPRVLLAYKGAFPVQTARFLKKLRVEEAADELHPITK